MPIAQVPDPTFAQGIVGHGAAIDPPHEVVDAVAPISGTVLQMMPHAYIILSADNVGVLVHLGLDTVELKGEGFTALVAKGDHVEAGQPVIAYDVPAIVAAGRNPIIPVVVMDKKPIKDQQWICVCVCVCARSIDGGDGSGAIERERD